MADIADLIAVTNRKLTHAEIIDPEFSQRAAAYYENLCAAGQTPGEAQLALQHFLDLSVLHAAATLVRSKHSAQARDLLQSLAERHPEDIGIMIALGRVHVIEEHFDIAKALFLDVLDRSPGNRYAYGNLALLYEKMGDNAAADEAWRSGFAEGMVVREPFTGSGRAPRVLVVSSILPGNLRYRKFIDTDHFEIIKIVAESFAEDIPLPDHDVVFQAIGDADLCRHGLERARRTLARGNAPILNPPQQVLQTGRASIAARLGAMPNVVTAKTVLLARDRLMHDGGIDEIHRHGLKLPCLLRSPGFHTGKHFALAESAEELRTIASSLPRDEIFAIAYLNTRRADGTFRKYRVMTIGGRLFPLHLAISNDWKVHYFTSEMHDHQAFRDEEAAFLAHMPSVLGPAVMKTLEQIFEQLQLDYGGIDFTIDEAGRLVVFEANATMVILKPKADQRWEYRRAPIEAALEAARSMIYKHASRHKNVG